MLLSEEHRIKACSSRSLFRQIDSYCYCAKNLSNSVNYMIRQIFRIHTKLKEGKVPEEWEAELMEQVNCGIRDYNEGRAKDRTLRHIDETNGFVADAYFLSWYLKKTAEYKAMPYATCSQICIQEKCREWKAFYRAKAAYAKDASSFAGRPCPPGYLDPSKGRGWLVITSQNFRIDENRNVIMPGFLKGIHIRARHDSVRQIRILTAGDGIVIRLIYEKKEAPATETKNVMGIDLGVDNLIAAAWNSDKPPLVLNGRPLKSMNQYYNKRKARLQEEAKSANGLDMTRRMERLTKKRNRKVKDYLHKASRKIVQLAEAANTSLIVIGANRGWKQKVNLGNRTNQNFVAIPYKTLIDMIRYKAALKGIEVKVVEEGYTSGTSYLDGEFPEAASYDRKRRIKRGLFKSNSGTCINADVNAAYQMMKLAGVCNLQIKAGEKVTRIKAA